MELQVDTYQQWRQVWRRLVQNGRLERLNPRSQYSEVCETVEVCVTRAKLRVDFLQRIEI